MPIPGASNTGNFITPIPLPGQPHKPHPSLAHTTPLAPLFETLPGHDADMGLLSTHPQGPAAPLSLEHLNIDALGVPQAASVGAATAHEAPPHPDTAKTWGNPEYKRDLNFGHAPAKDGELLKAKPDGTVVWGDTGTALTADQFANMPTFQKAKLEATVAPEQRGAFEQAMAHGNAQSAHEEVPPPPTHARPANVGDPSSFFISQYISPSNPEETVANNGNCGPTSVLMAVKAFGKVAPTPGEVHGEILDIRHRAGAGMDERDGHNSATDVQQLTRAAHSYGLKAQTLGDATVQNVHDQLASGHLVVALVKPGFYNPKSHSTGHYVLVTGMKDGKVELNDPMRHDHPITITEAQFGEAFNAKGGKGVSITA